MKYSKRKKETEARLPFTISGPYAVIRTDEFAFVIGSDFGVEKGVIKGTEKGGQEG